MSKPKRSRQSRQNQTQRLARPMITTIAPELAAELDREGDDLTRKLELIHATALWADHEQNVGYLTTLEDAISIWSHELDNWFNALSFKVLQPIIDGHVRPRLQLVPPPTPEPEPAGDDRLLTVQEAAERLGTSPRVVWRKRTQEPYKSLIVDDGSGRVRFSAARIDAFRR